MSLSALAAIVVAATSGAQETLPPQLELFNNATSHGSPFKRECFVGRQIRRLHRIEDRLDAARGKLIAHYGEAAVNNAYAFITEGAVKIYRPCDHAEQETYLDRRDGSVRDLEDSLKVK